MWRGRRGERWLGRGEGLEAAACGSQVRKGAWEVMWKVLGLSEQEEDAAIQLDASQLCRLVRCWENDLVFCPGGLLVCSQYSIILSGWGQCSNWWVVCVCVCSVWCESVSAMWGVMWVWCVCGVWVWGVVWCVSVMCECEGWCDVWVCCGGVECVSVVCECEVWCDVWVWCVSVL